jgi:hypothetical protein
VGAVAVLAVVVQVLAAGAVVRYTRPRLPGLAAAVPVLDRAIAEVVDGAGDRAAVAISPLVPLTTCQVTPLARGRLVSRTADLYTDPGQEAALIGRIAAALPAADHPSRAATVGSGPPPLTADLGTGLSLRVTRLGTGWLEAIAQTDCRDTGRTVAPSAPAAPDPTTVRVLAALGTTAAGTHADRLACPGGTIVTLSTVSAPTDPTNLRNRLAEAVPASARRFVATGNRLAWRDGGTSVVVAASDDGRHVTAQVTASGC